MVGSAFILTGMQFVDGRLVGKSPSAIEKGYESLTHLNDQGKDLQGNRRHHSGTPGEVLCYI
jgi:hypothetical protein